MKQLDVLSAEPLNHEVDMTYDKAIRLDAAPPMYWAAASI